MPATILIVDDHDDFRRSARALLENDGFSVVGEAGDGSEAIALASSLHPAVVLLDIQLPGRDGFSVAEELMTWVDPPAVVLVSSRDAAVYAAKLTRTRARGFLSKSELSGAAVAALVR